MESKKTWVFFITFSCLIHGQVLYGGSGQSKYWKGHYIGNEAHRNEALRGLKRVEQVSPLDLQIRTRQIALHGHERRQVEFHTTGHAPSPPFGPGDTIYHGTGSLTRAKDIVKNGLKVQNIKNGPDSRVNLVNKGGHVVPMGVAWVTKDINEARSYAGDDGVILKKRVRKRDMPHAEGSLNQDSEHAAAFNRTTKGWSIIKK